MQPWAALVSGTLSGVASSIVLSCARKYAPYWTNGSTVDLTYTHGIPGVLSALAGRLKARNVAGDKFRSKVIDLF